MSETAPQLPTDIAALQALLAAAQAERDAAIAERDQALSRVDRLQHLLHQLQRAQFGRRSEKLDSDQLQLGLEDIEQAIAADEADIGAAKERQRYREAERPRGLEVEDHLDLGGLLNRKVGGLVALEDAAGIDAGQAGGISYAAAVAGKPPGGNELAALIDCGHLMTGSELAKLAAPAVEELHPDQFGKEQHSIVQRLLRALRKSAANRLIAATPPEAYENVGQLPGGCGRLELCTTRPAHSPSPCSSSQS